MQSNIEKNKNTLGFSESEMNEAEEIMLNHRIIEVIKNLMSKNGIKNNSELASKLGVSPAYISNIFSSNKYINISFLVKLERVFDTLFTFSAESLEVSPQIFQAHSSSINDNLFYDIYAKNPDKECVVIPLNTVKLNNYHNGMSNYSYNPENKNVKSF